MLALNKGYELAKLRHLAILRRSVLRVARSFPRRSAWPTQLRRNIAAVASRWRHCINLNSPGIEPKTSSTDSVCLATQLTGRTKRSTSIIMVLGAQGSRILPSLKCFEFAG